MFILPCLPLFWKTEVSGSLFHYYFLVDRSDSGIHHWSSLRLSCCVLHFKVNNRGWIMRARGKLISFFSLNNVFPYFSTPFILTHWPRCWRIDHLCHKLCVHQFVSLWGSCTEKTSYIIRSISSSVQIVVWSSKGLIFFNETRSLTFEHRSR